MSSSTKRNMATTSTKFEPIVNENGTVYKLRGRLSKNKVADISVVPKTKLAYLHINDYTNAWNEGSFDKQCSKFVSLSMKEAAVLRQLMYTMDEPVQTLIQSAPTTAKRRKTEKNRQIPSYVTSRQYQATANNDWATGTYGGIPTNASYGQEQAYDPEWPAFGGQSLQQQPGSFSQTADQYQTGAAWTYSPTTPSLSAQPLGQGGLPIASTAPVQRFAAAGQQPLGQVGIPTASVAPMQQVPLTGQNQTSTTAADSDQDYINQLFAAYQ